MVLTSCTQRAYYCRTANNSTWPSCDQYDMTSAAHSSRVLHFSYHVTRTSHWTRVTWWSAESVHTKNCRPWNYNFQKHSPGHTRPRTAYTCTTDQHVRAQTNTFYNRLTYSQAYCPRLWQCFPVSLSLSLFGVTNLSMSPYFCWYPWTAGYDCRLRLLPVESNRALSRLSERVLSYVWACRADRPEHVCSARDTAAPPTRR